MAGLAQLVVALVSLSLVAGCSSDPPAELPPVPQSDPPPARSDVTGPVGCAFPDKYEVWDVVQMQGQKIGHAHTRIDRVTVDGRPMIRMQWTNEAKIVRFGEPTEMKTELTSHETPDGKLVDFVEIQQLGPTPVRVEGRVEGDSLVLEKKGPGETRTVELPWSDVDSGHHGVENSLAAKPMKPGETRNLRVLVPMYNQVADVRLVARGYETTPLLHGDHQLLRIDQTIWQGGTRMNIAIWADQKGEILKTKMNTADVYRATKAEALDESDLGKVDLGLDMLVPVDRKIDDPHHTRRIRYQVSLDDADPAGSFVVGPSQRIKPIDATTAELTVTALRPGEPKKIDNPRADRPTLDDVNPNSLIQSDDELVRKMAAEATEGKNDDWSKAVALERYVHEAIDNTNFSNALASAAEVAKRREGDCTEHAVLLAAMARAVDLPARVAIGLVYFQPKGASKPAFGYHMWTEIYVLDRWIPMDATLGLGGVGAAHLKLAHANFKDADALSSTIPVMNVLGRLKIKVLDVEPN